MNPGASKHLSEVDRILARIIRRVGPVDVRPPRGVSPYMSLVQAVAHQQLTGKAAKTILGRVLALYPGKKFPAPEDLLKTPNRKLRAAGFSWAKVRAVKDIAAKTIEGVGVVVRVETDPSGMGVVFKELSGYSRDLIEKLLTARIGTTGV